MTPPSCEIPAKNAAKHISAPFIARIDAVSQQKADRAGVIGQHPVRGSVLGGAIVGAADQLSDPGDEGQKEISMKVVVFSLHDRRNALESRPGID